MAGVVPPLPVTTSVTQSLSEPVLQQGSLPLDPLSAARERLHAVKEYVDNPSRTDSEKIMLVQQLNKINEQMGAWVKTGGTEEQKNRQTQYNKMYPKMNDKHKEILQALGVTELKDLTNYGIQYTIQNNAQTTKRTEEQEPEYTAYPSKATPVKKSRIIIEKGLTPSPQERRMLAKIETKTPSSGDGNQAAKHPNQQSLPTGNVLVQDLPKDIQNEWNQYQVTFTKKQDWGPFGSLAFSSTIKHNIRKKIETTISRLSDADKSAAEQFRKEFEASFIDFYVKNVRNGDTLNIRQGSDYDFVGISTKNNRVFVYPKKYREITKKIIFSN